MDTLIELIRQRIADPSKVTDCCDVVDAVVSPPATAEQVALAEDALKRSLPPFLVELYGEIGNGGFGPDYGLIGLPGGAVDDLDCDAVTLYEAFRRPSAKDPYWKWPNSLFPIIHCGCAMYLCSNCTTPEGNMVWFEPNPHDPGEPWDSSFIPLSCNIRELFAAWVEGRHWLEFITRED